MAKRKKSRKKTGRSGVNRSEEIRKAFEKMGGDAAPKDIIKVLGARRIKVSSALVSNVRAAMAGGSRTRGKGKSRRRGRPRRSAPNGSVVLADLLEAKRLIEKTGGIEQAKQALDALARLS